MAISSSNPGLSSNNANHLYTNCAFSSKNKEKKETVYYKVEGIADGLLKTEPVDKAAVGGQVEIFLKNKKLGSGMVWEFNQKNT